MDDTELSDNGLGTDWWREPDPERAHEKYLRMHASATNRSKLLITERLLSQCDWRGRRVLEYGCGGGYFTIWMAERGAEVHAIETNPCAIGAVEFYARRAGVSDRVHVIRGDAERDTIAGEYDFIFAKDLVEHLQDDRPFFQRLAQQLKVGGHTYIATQNDHSLNFLVEGAYERLFRGNKAWYGWDRTHCRFYNAPLLAERLKEVGIMPERWGSSYLVPWRFATKRLLGSPRPWSGWTTLDQTLGTTRPFAKLGWSIMVVGRKS
jgi:2-polyprenyl-6-hydroxyphenyl methylase/3-demethylubiquinone-9 3-methyltransferase